MIMLKTATAALAIALSGTSTTILQHGRSDPPPFVMRTAGTTTPVKPPGEPTPEERMARRFPQPVKVGDLIGLPVLDDRDRTLGRITTVVRTASGKIQLIVSYGGFLGFGKRPVAVPIEVVAIAGRQVAALDMDRAAFDAAPDWNEPTSKPIPHSETIRIGLYKR